MPHYDIQDVFQYSDYTLIFQAKDVNGIPIDLTDYTIGSCIRERFSAATGVANFSGVITVPDSGICSMFFSAAQSSGLAPNTYIYTIQVTSTEDNSSFNLLNGYLNINPGIPTC